MIHVPVKPWEKHSTTNRGTIPPNGNAQDATLCIINDTVVSDPVFCQLQRQTTKLMT